MYNSQIERQFNDNNVRVLSVRANGGSLQVQKKVGNNWITANTYSADISLPMVFGKGTPTRFVPAGGAEFEVDE